MRERETQEREEQSADVEQTNLSFLSDNLKQSVSTATRIVCRYGANLHNHVVCIMPIYFSFVMDKTSVMITAQSK